MNAQTPKKSFAAYDIDGSLFREQTLAMLIRQFVDRRIFSQRAGSEYRKLRHAHASRHISFQEYNRGLIDLFLRNIKGKKVSDFRKAARGLVRKHRDLLYTFPKALLAELKSTHHCIAVTGAIQEVVELAAPYWGFEEFYATELEIVDGGYTGRDKVLHVGDKAAALRDYIAKTGVGLAGSVALGDTISDAPILSMVETPIAFHPDNALCEQAQRYRWPIIHERKDCVCVVIAGVARYFSIDRIGEAVAHVLESSRRPPPDPFGSGPAIV